MRFHVVVTGRRLAEQTLRWHEADYVVSITDPDAPQARLGHTPCLRLAFDDVTIPHPGYRMVTTSDISKVLLFARAIPNKAKVLVHCEQGISRSPAIAIVLLLADGRAKPAEVVDYVLAHCRGTDAPHPNRAVLAAAEGVLRYAPRSLVDLVERKTRERY